MYQTRIIMCNHSQISHITKAIIKYEVIGLHSSTISKDILDHQSCRQIQHVFFRQMIQNFEFLRARKLPITHFRNQKGYTFYLGMDILKCLIRLPTTFQASNGMVSARKKVEFFSIRS